MYKIGCRLQKANHSARVTALRSPKNVANENPIVDLECDRNGAAMTCHPSVCVKCRQLCGGGGAAMQPTWTVKKLHVVSCTSLERAQHARCNTSLSQSGRGEVSVDRCATTSGPTTLVYVSRCFAMLWASQGVVTSSILSPRVILSNPARAVRVSLDLTTYSRSDSLLCVCVCVLLRGSGYTLPTPDFSVGLAT